MFLLMLTGHCWLCRYQNKVSGLSAKSKQSSIKQQKASEWTTLANTCFFLFSWGAGCLSVVVHCHMIILFVIWIKVVLEAALTFRPRCTWAEWGPSCGAAAGTGPDRCSAGTDLASAWTPEYDTGCQLVFGATVRQEKTKLKGLTHSSLPCANLEKQTYCCCHERHLWPQVWEPCHGNGWWVVNLGNKFNHFVLLFCNSSQLYTAVKNKVSNSIPHI